jgi:uncharacterized glyoxalase superfamily protein PhnB
MRTVEEYQAQAERLLRWHREGNYSIGEHVRRLERYRALTDSQVLALDLTLTIAQEIVAIESGQESWADLKAARADTGPRAFKSVVPIFFVRDVERSATWFKDMLGFDIDFLHGKPPFYGSVSRDGVCLHLRFVHEPYFTQVAAHETSLILATIEVEDVRPLFEEFNARGVEFPQTVKQQPWGGTDFHVRDPDGNVFSFVS